MKANRIINLIVKKSFISIILIIFGVCLLRSTGYAQIANTKNTPDLALRSNFTVDPATLGLNLRIPLGTYTGRNGVNIPVAINYSSKVWRMAFIDRREYPAPDEYNGYLLEPLYAEHSLAGWTSTLDVPWIGYEVPEWGYSQTSGIAGNCNIPGTFPQPCYFISNMYVHMPDGSSHELRKDDVPRTSLDRTGTYHSVDGSNMRFEYGSNMLYLSDGSRYKFPPLTTPPYPALWKALYFIDKNGNKLAYESANRSWTDTLGRSIKLPFPVDPTHNTDQATGVPDNPAVGDYTATLKGINGEDLTYMFRWRKLADVRTDPNQPLHYRGSNRFTYANPLRPEPHLFKKQALNYVCSSDDFFNPSVLHEVVLPNSSSYVFTYNVYGEIDKVRYPNGGYESFRLGYVVDGTTGIINAYNQPHRGALERRISPSGSGNDEQIWQYTKLSSDGSNLITAPDGTKTKLFYYVDTTLRPPFGLQDAKVGKPKEVQLYAPDGVSLLRRSLSEWSNQGPTPGGYSSATRNPYLVKQAEISFEAGSTQALAGVTTFQYDPYLNVTSTTAHGFVVLDANTAQTITIDQIPLGSTLKTVETDYITDTPYLDRNLVSLPSAVRIKDGAGNIVAKRETKYDEIEYPVLIYGTQTVGWEDPGTGTKRGLPTTTKAWDSSASGGVGNWIVSHMQYDQFGNPRKTWSPVYEGQPTENVSEIRYEDNFSDQTNRYSYALPTRTISVTPDQTGQNGSSSPFETTIKYDFTTSLPVSGTDANGQITTISYADPLTGVIDPLLRVRKITAPNGQQIITNYGLPDSNGQFPASERFVKVQTQLDVDKWNEVYTWFDGLGRTVKTQQMDTPGDIYVETEYDNMGRVVKVSNPYRSGEAVYWMETTYDDLSRVMKIKTSGDNAEVNTIYSLATTGSQIGTVVTVTDQAGKIRRSISNALGQLIRVDEPTDTAGLGPIDNPNQPTIYSYNALNNLMAVQQNGVNILQCGGASNCSQTRTFVYDSLSRLESATNPESGTINYTYDSKGNLVTKTDARGIVTTYTYDALNRLKMRSYTNEPTGAETPDVTYFYDNLTNAKGKLIKIASSVSTTEYTAFDILGRVTQSKQITDGITYGNGTTDSMMTYTSNMAGALIEQQYPSGRVVRNVLDGSGDLSIVESKKNSDSGFWHYADNFAYNAAGAVTAMQLGNGRWESTVFNSRLQATRIALGTTSSATDLLRLDFEYGEVNPGTGQIIPGTNNGNIGKQKISVPTVGQSAGFTAQQYYAYDSLSRIQSATENTENPGQPIVFSWKQEFRYDRYGNRSFFEANTSTLPRYCNNNTEVCPADRKVYNPSIAAGTNKINLDQDGDSVNDYSFDATGNTTRDAHLRKFTYDGENKLVKVETVNVAGTVTGIVGEYWYDGNGSRIKKRGYINNVLTEETAFVYDAAGKLIAEYSQNVASVNDAKVAYLTNDHLGSPRINTDRDGKVTARHDYHPFGEEIATEQYDVTSSRKSVFGYGDDTIRKQFTGYERDNETKLDFAQARYYAQYLGRFVSPDNFVNDTTTNDTQSWNLYVYARNNPLYFVDPNGEAIYLGNIASQKEREEVLRRINFTYGCASCVKVDADGYLTVDTSGLSQEIIGATQFLTDAINSRTQHFAVEITNDNPDVAFGDSGGATVGVPNRENRTGKPVSALRVRLDFGDDRHVTGDASAREGFLNTVFAHEIRHWAPRADPDPTGAAAASSRGPVVNAINEILLARDKPLRERYAGMPTRNNRDIVELTHGRAGRERRTRNVERRRDGINVVNETNRAIRWSLRNVGGRGIN